MKAMQLSSLYLPGTLVLCALAVLSGWHAQRLCAAAGQPSYLRITLSWPRDAHAAGVADGVCLSLELPKVQYVTCWQSFSSAPSAQRSPSAPTSYWGGRWPAHPAGYGCLYVALRPIGSSPALAITPRPSAPCAQPDASLGDLLGRSQRRTLSVRFAT